MISVPTIGLGVGSAAQRSAGGTPAFAIERSLRFDGSNDYINTGGVTADSWNPYNNTDWTISFWAKCDTGDTRFQNNGTIICTNYQAGSSNPQLYVQTVNATGGSKFKLRIPFLNGSTKSYKIFTSSHVITNAECQVWQHYAITLTQNSGTSKQDIEIYVNNTSVDTGSVDQANFTQASFALAIGSRNPTIAFQTWKGFIAEIGLWETALSSGDLTAVYGGGSGSDLTTIGTVTGYYRPLTTDGPTTGSITDSSGNKDLTMNGFVTDYGVVSDTP